MRKTTDPMDVARSIDCQLSSIHEALLGLTSLLADELPTLTLTINEVVRSLDEIERAI